MPFSKQETDDANDGQGMQPPLIDPATLPSLVVKIEQLVEFLKRESVRDPDIMTLDAAARALECSVDTLRRIPQAQLPAYRVGKVNLYFREDILRYVRSRPADRHGPGLRKGGKPVGSGDEIDERLDDMLKSSSVNVRKPSERRAR